MQRRGEDQVGREALQHYRRGYNTRLKEFTAIPVHDWASHGADAFRGLAVRYTRPRRERFAGRGRRAHVVGKRMWMH